MTQRSRIAQMMSARTRHWVNFDDRYMREATASFLGKVGRLGHDLQHLVRIETQGAPLAAEAEAMMLKIQEQIETLFYETFGHEMKPQVPQEEP